MQSHDNTAKAHIGAESSSTRSSIATRKRALQQAKALRRSAITHFRWSPAFGCLVHQCRQARGGIPLVAISVRACMPGQRIFTSRMGENGGTGIVFLFRPHRGVSGDQPIRFPTLPTNSVRACPQRTQTAPIYSAQFRPSVKKRTKVARELRDPAGLGKPRCQWPAQWRASFIARSWAPPLNESTALSGRRPGSQCAQS